MLVVSKAHHSSTRNVPYANHNVCPSTGSNNNCWWLFATFCRDNLLNLFEQYKHNKMGDIFLKQTQQILRIQMKGNTGSTTTKQKKLNKTFAYTNNRRILIWEKKYLLFPPPPGLVECYVQIMLDVHKKMLQSKSQWRRKEKFCNQLGVMAWLPLVLVKQAHLRTSVLYVALYSIIGIGNHIKVNIHQIRLYSIWVEQKKKKEIANTTNWGLFYFSTKSMRK